jgi:glycosyltransferase involved in cell wall biosynthesis
MGLDTGMRVLYDHQAFLHQYGGISRYFAALMRELITAESAQVQVPFRWVQNAYLMQSAPAKFRDPFVGASFRGKARIIDLSNKLLLRMALRRNAFDVFHPTYYDDYFMRDLGRKPLIVTVFDLIAQRLPDYPAVYEKSERNKKRLSEQAARVIAISESTRQDLIALFGTAPERVVTIPLAADRLDPCNAFSFPVPDRYVLYVGKRSGYKNFGRFSEAMAILFARDPDLHLFCVGGGPLKDAETEAIRHPVLQGRVHCRSTNDSTLAALYRKAQAFVFPSLYEGFGIPILESLQMGCPAVISARSSFPEVAGDAAVYFDPEDSASIADAIQRVIYDEDLRNRLRDLGYKRERDFSWRTTAMRTRELYQQVL